VVNYQLVSYGQLIVTGISSYSNNYLYNGNGSLIGSGIATTTVVYSYLTTGQFTVNGATSTYECVFYLAGGKISVYGIGILNIQYVIGCTGEVLLLGISTTLTSYVYLTSGKINVNGLMSAYTDIIVTATVGQLAFTGIPSQSVMLLAIVGGKINISGVGNATINVICLANGSLIVSGIATVSLVNNFVYETSGKLDFNGLISLTGTCVYVPSATTVFIVGVSRDQTITASYTGIGSLIVNGINVITQVFNFVPYGSINLAGITTTTVSVVLSSIGKLTFNGISTSTVGYRYQPIGALAVTGTSGVVGGIVILASGSMHHDGIAAVTTTVVTFGVGAVTVAGNASLQTTGNINAVGRLVVAGIQLNQVNFNYLTFGGLTLNGFAVNTYSYVFNGQGKLTVSGATTPPTLIFTVEPVGKLTTTGTILSTVTGIVYPTGILVVVGANLLQGNFVYTSSLTISLSGIAKVNEPIGVFSLNSTNKFSLSGKSTATFTVHGKILPFKFDLGTEIIIVTEDNRVDYIYTKHIVHNQPYYRLKNGTRRYHQDELQVPYSTEYWSRIKDISEENIEKLNNIIPSVNPSHGPTTYGTITNDDLAGEIAKSINTIANNIDKLETTTPVTNPSHGSTVYGTITNDNLAGEIAKSINAIADNIDKLESMPLVVNPMRELKYVKGESEVEVEYWSRIKAVSEENIEKLNTVVPSVNPSHGSTVYGTVMNNNLAGEIDKSRNTIVNNINKLNTTTPMVNPTHGSKYINNKAGDRITLNGKSYKILSIHKNFNKAMYKLSNNIWYSEEELNNNNYVDQLRNLIT
jgi:ribosomal protein S13